MSNFEFSSIITIRALHSRADIVEIPLKWMQCKHRIQGFVEIKGFAAKIRETEVWKGQTEEGICPGPRIIKC